MVTKQHAAMLILLGVTIVPSAQCSGQSQTETWRATWAASPSAWLPTNPVIPPVPPFLKTLADTDAAQTVRDVVHVTSGGDKCRVRISNVFGKEPLLVIATHAALQSTESGIAAGTDRVVTFDEETSVTIPPGADVLSDPIQLRIPMNANLSISLTSKGRKSAYAIHFLALQTSYVAPGDQAGSETLRDAVAIPSWPYLTEVQVAGKGASEGTVVAFGDSITDGALTTANTNRRWPNRFFERLAEKKLNVAVTDAGIAGNRLLNDAQGNYGSVFGMNGVARFDRDVLSEAGVRYVIVFLGTNDIRQPGAGGVPMDSTVSVREIEVGLSQLIERAHEQGVRVIGATMLPFGGSLAPHKYTAEMERMREEINAWIRTNKKFDAVADFDKAVRDPVDESRMQAKLDGGDHIHPNDAGAKALADSIPVDLFSGAYPPGRGRLSKTSGR